jgi:hypothetical protein
MAPLLLLCCLAADCLAMPHMVHMLVAGVALIIFAATTACMVSGWVGLAHASLCHCSVVQEVAALSSGRVTLWHAHTPACTCMTTSLSSLYHSHSRLHTRLTPKPIDVCCSPWASASST